MLINCPTKNTSRSNTKIGSLFRRQQRIKHRVAQICTPLIWIGLNDFGNSLAWFWCEFFLLFFFLLNIFFCNYYCSKWYHEHRICNWLVNEKKLGAATFWVRYFFQAAIPFLVLFPDTFWKKIVYLFCKSLPPFLTLGNCEGPYFAQGFLHNLCQCFDIVFAPLGVMPRTNKIVEIAAASECYLIINLLKNKESKKQLFRIYLPIKLAEGKISMKKEKNSSKLIYNIASFIKMAGKTDFFFQEE